MEALQTPKVLGALGPVVLFALAMLNTRYAVVYRRNNLAAVGAVAMATMGIYMWGWLGLAAFVAGTVLGAAEWVGEIRRANASVTPAAMTQHSPSPSAACYGRRRADLPRVRA